MKPIIGIGELSIFAAHAAFKGHIGYDLSMIADFDIDDVRYGACFDSIASVSSPQIMLAQAPLSFLNPDHNTHTDHAPLQSRSRRG